MVSTPYWHAQELLADGRGHLFPFKDHAALSRTLLELCGSPAELQRVRHAAFEFTQPMEWPRIGDTYFEMIRTALRAGPRFALPRIAARTGSGERVAGAQPRSPATHDRRYRHRSARHLQRAGSAHGYCVDDNARALIVAVQADRVQASAAARALVTKYLSYLHCSQETDGVFRNFMSYDRSLERARASDDCIGRALWALGVTATLAADEGCRALARDMFARALPHADELGPRGTAQAILGLASMLAAAPDSTEMRSALDRLVEKLAERYHNHATEEWRWFEPTLTYDNAILPLALFAAYEVTRERATLRVARESLEFLEDVCFHGDRLQLVGNTGWHSRGGKKARADEQAIDAAAFVLAFRCAYKVTADRHYLRRMRESFAWFLGANRLGVPLYDFATGGCCDGMGVAEVNRNQGAESTICFLLSLLKMLELAGEELETRRRASRWLPSLHDVPCDHAYSPSRPTRLPPRARQALPSWRGNSAAWPVACSPIDDADSGDSRGRSGSAERGDHAAIRRASSAFSADARAAVRCAGGARPRSRRGVCRAPLVDRGLFHARIRGRGGCIVQPIDRACAGSERCRERLAAFHHEPACGGRGASVIDRVSHGRPRRRRGPHARRSGDQPRGWPSDRARLLQEDAASPRSCSSSAPSTISRRAS